MRRRRLFTHTVAVSLVAGMGAMAAPAAQAADPVTLLSEDFEDGEYAALELTGGPTLSVVDADGDKALLVKGRTNDYDGVKTPANLLQPGGSYTFSMQLKLAAGTAPTEARFVVEPDYTWVGNTRVTADAWTTVSGTFKAPASAQAATLRAFIGTAALTGSYDYLVDDLRITGTPAADGGTWQPTPDLSFVPGGAVNPTSIPVNQARGTGNVTALTFDDGPNPGETDALLDFLQSKDIQATFCVIGQNIQAPGGAELLKRIVAEGHTLCNHTTSYADMRTWTHAEVEADLKANLKIIRDALGDPSQPVPYFRAPNGGFGVTGEVAAALGMQPLGLGNLIFDWDGNDLSEATLTKNTRDAITPGAVFLGHDGGGNRENTIKAVRTVVTERLASGWTFTLPQGGAATPIQNLPGLKDVLGDAGIEHVGVAIDRRETTGRASELLRRHFNAITPENAGKPESVQPREGEFNFEQLDALLDYADANDIEVYGHVLVWHSQTPAWFFKDGNRDLTSSRADRALLRKRMEAHIKGVADHINARYPDGNSPIWAWDVVNEVIADGDNANPHDMRDSRWFQVLGQGFVDDAFRLADKYFPEQELFINDYNTEMPEKRADYLSLIRALERRGVPIDGVGHQAHVDVARPVQWLEDSIRAVRRLDPTLLQAITELDVNASTENQGADVSNGTQDPYSPAFENDEDAGAEVGYYYRDLFAMLRKQARSVDSVTFWGISNNRSWLRGWPMPRPWEQPLPFDDDLQAAPAYWGIVDPSKLPARPEDVLPPRIASVSTIKVETHRRRGVRVRYARPSAIDTQDGKVRLRCTPRRGSLFPVGTTTVTCTARDRAGNVRTSTFDVVVERTSDRR